MKHPATSPERIQTIIDRLGGVRAYASAVGVSQSTVRTWLRGKSKPSIPKQKAIARLHGQHATPAEAKMVYWVLSATDEALRDSVINAKCDNAPKPVMDKLYEEMWQIRRWTADYLYVARSKIETPE